jgi:hypothetical protein
MILGTLDKGLIDSENAVRTGSIQGAAGLVRMGHEGRSAGHRHQGGAGSRTRTAGLARSLRPARTMERPGRRRAEAVHQGLGPDAALGASPNAHGKQAQPMAISGNLLILIRLRSLRL